jgi:hypothetical protein
VCYFDSHLRARVLHSRDGYVSTGNEYRAAEI